MGFPLPILYLSIFFFLEIKVGNKISEAKEFFNATHPFLYFIEGPDGLVLFIGKVENPLEEDARQLPSRAGIDDDTPGMFLDKITF